MCIGITYWAYFHVESGCKLSIVSENISMYLKVYRNEDNSKAELGFARDFFPEDFFLSSISHQPRVL